MDLLNLFVSVIAVIIALFREEIREILFNLKK